MVFRFVIRLANIKGWRHRHSHCHVMWTVCGNTLPHICADKIMLADAWERCFLQKNNCLCCISNYLERRCMCVTSKYCLIRQYTLRNRRARIVTQSIWPNYTYYKKNFLRIAGFHTVMFLVIRIYVVENQKHLCDQITWIKWHSHYRFRLRKHYPNKPHVFVRMICMRV